MSLIVFLSCLFADWAAFGENDIAALYSRTLRFQQRNNAWIDLNKVKWYLVLSMPLKVNMKKTATTGKNWKREKKSSWKEHTVRTRWTPLCFYVVLTSVNTSWLSILLAAKMNMFLFAFSIFHIFSCVAVGFSIHISKINLMSWLCMERTRSQNKYSHWIPNWLRKACVQRTNNYFS